MYGNFTHPEYGSPLTAGDLELGLEFVVYNHEHRQIIHRGTIASPVWAETNNGRYGVLFGTTHKVLVERKNYRNETVYEPAYASDMGLLPYYTGLMNTVNRTYRIDRQPKHRAEEAPHHVVSPVAIWG